MVYLSMKREREEDQNSLATTANYLMLLSRDGRDSFNSATISPSTRVFQCTTCNRQFSSFQALGGHRASHKRSNLTGRDMNSLDQHQLQKSPSKPKTHECSICGLEFAVGQALGGHMRRHRSASVKESLENLPVLSLSSTSGGEIVKKSRSKRVFYFDLNLMPLENGTPAGPVIHSYL